MGLGCFQPLSTLVRVSNANFKGLICCFCLLVLLFFFFIYLLGLSGVDWSLNLSILRGPQVLIGFHRQSGTPPFEAAARSHLLPNVIALPPNNSNLGGMNSG